MMVFGLAWPTCPTKVDICGVMVRLLPALLFTLRSSNHITEVEIVEVALKS